jgi:hypothetical protein
VLAALVIIWLLRLSRGRGDLLRGRKSSARPTGADRARWFEGALPLIVDAEASLCASISRLLAIWTLRGVALDRLRGFFTQVTCTGCRFR